MSTSTSSNLIYLFNMNIVYNIFHYLKELDGPDLKLQDVVDLIVLLQPASHRDLNSALTQSLKKKKQKKKLITILDKHKGDLT